jgi:hypothetical protein
MVVTVVWIARNGLLLARLCGSKMDYRSYITSTEWRSKHKDFLKDSHYRCAFFPWVKVGKKHRYNVHHMNYENLGSERLWVDVICLCPFAHSFIIHGLLSGFRRPSQQRTYPNMVQRLAHCWCCIPVLVRGTLVVLMLVNLVKIAI